MTPLDEGLARRVHEGRLHGPDPAQQLQSPREVSLVPGVVRALLAPPDDLRHLLDHAPRPRVL